MRDFSFDIYKKLLETAQSKGYRLVSYQEFVEGSKEGKLLILRHDVDALPENAFQTALIENELGARASYYFRSVKQSYNELVIAEIKMLGHEIGYHYEDLAICKGDLDKAYLHFTQQLERFRKLADIKTICMHGSPLSKWDNRLLWKKYDYRALGIIAEPYFDTDFAKVLYLTDTGRQWNSRASVRDKVNGSLSLKVRSTLHLIELFAKDALPPHIMINTHPQRWTNNSYFWLKELLLQNLKNVVKFFLIKLRK